jgi:S-adenosylmethionine decarboxylase
MNSATVGGPQAEETGALDHFVQRDGLCFAGTHLIIDLWGARRLDDIAFIETTLRQAVQLSGATLLHIHLHHFTPNAGVSGVAVLAESHISIHTWPERQYAALDVFMCGDADPYRAIAVLRDAFEPSAVQINDHKRGIL